MRFLAARNHSGVVFIEVVHSYRENHQERARCRIPGSFGRAGRPARSAEDIAPCCGDSAAEAVRRDRGSGRVGRHRGLRRIEAGTMAGDSAVCGRHSERRHAAAILPQHRSAGIPGGVRCFRARPASRSGEPPDCSGRPDVAAQSGGSRQGGCPW